MLLLPPQRIVHKQVSKNVEFEIKLLNRMENQNTAIGQELKPVEFVFILTISGAPCAGCAICFRPLF